MQQATPNAERIKSKLPVCFNCHPSRNDSTQLFDDWDGLYFKLEQSLVLTGNVRITDVYERQFKRFLMNWNATFASISDTTSPGSKKNSQHVPYPDDLDMDSVRNILCNVRKEMLSIAGICCHYRWKQFRDDFSKQVTSAFESALDTSEVNTCPTTKDDNETGGKQNDLKEKERVRASETKQKIICPCCNQRYLHPYPAVNIVVKGISSATVSSLIRCTVSTDGAAKSWEGHGNRAIYAYPKQLKDLMSFTLFKVVLPKEVQEGMDCSTLCETMLTIHCRLFMTVYLNKHSPEMVNDVYFRLLPIQRMEDLQRIFYTAFKELETRGYKSKVETLVSNNITKEALGFSYLKALERFTTIIKALKDDAQDAVEAVLYILSTEPSNEYGSIVLPSDLNDTEKTEALEKLLMLRLFDKPRDMLVEYLEASGERKLLVANDVQNLTDDRLQKLKSYVQDKMKSMAKLIIVHFLQVRLFAKEELKIDDSSSTA